MSSGVASGAVSTPPDIALSSLNEPDRRKGDRRQRGPAWQLKAAPGHSRAEDVIFAVVIFFNFVVILSLRG